LLGVHYDDDSTWSVLVHNVLNSSTLNSFHGVSSSRLETQTSKQIKTQQPEGAY